MGEPATHHFDDCGIFERTLSSPHQQSSLETSGYPTKQEIPGALSKNVFCKSQISGNPEVCRFGNRRAPKDPADPSNEIFKILDMRSRSIKKHEMAIWQIFETLEPRKQLSFFLFFWSTIIFLLNLPIPTPAPVWGGPVDCIAGPVWGGPVAWQMSCWCETSWCATSLPSIV